MTEPITDVARRALEDPDYARSVYEGDEHPEVRAAIEADITDLLARDDEEVKGFLLREQAYPPDPISPQMFFASTAWVSLPRQNLTRLAYG